MFNYCYYFPLLPYTKNLILLSLIMEVQWNLVSSKRKGPVFFIRTKRSTHQKKKNGCVRIFPLPYADLFDRINVACLTVLSIWGLVPWIIFKFIRRQITNTVQQVSILDVFFFKKVINGNLLIFIHLSINILIINKNT